MRVLELIEKLKKVNEHHGNVEVRLQNDDYDPIDPIDSIDHHDKNGSLVAHYKDGSPLEIGKEVKFVCLN